MFRLAEPPAGATAMSALDRAAAPRPDDPAPASAGPTWAGLRRSALAEVLVFYAVALLIDTLLLDGGRFRGWSPHPFWLFIVVIAAHAGTLVGVFAAVVGALLASFGNLPPRDPLIDPSAYWLGVLVEPVLWFLSAVVLGELQTRRERQLLAATLRAETAEADSERLRLAATALELANERLQEAAAGQTQTALALVEAASSVDLRETSSVFHSVEGLIVSLLRPSAYSLYLLRGDQLELVGQTSDGQVPEARPRYFPGLPLYDAVIGQGRVVHVADAAGQAALGREGVLAGPLLDPSSGAPLGMLKIDAMPIVALHQGSLHAFRSLIEWIGRSYADAQRFEEANRARVSHQGSQLFTDAYYRPVSAFIVALAERANFEVCQLIVRVEATRTPALAEAPTVAVIVEEVVTSGLRSTDLAFDYQRERGEFVVILPMTQIKNCKLVADRLRYKLEALLAEAGHQARLAISYETLYMPTATDIKPWHRAVIRRTDPYTS
jgi:hypothetical protein